MDWGPRYLGGRKQIWSVLAGTPLIFRNIPLWKHSEKTSVHFCLDLRFCWKIHQSERWRGRPSEALKRDSLAELPFTHSSSTFSKVEQDKSETVFYFFLLFMFCKTIVIQAFSARQMTCYLLCLIFLFIKGFLLSFFYFNCWGGKNNPCIGF